MTWGGDGRAFAGVLDGSNKSVFEGEFVVAQAGRDVDSGPLVLYRGKETGVLGRFILVSLAGSKDQDSRLLLLAC